MRPCKAGSCERRKRGNGAKACWGSEAGSDGEWVMEKEGRVEKKKKNEGGKVRKTKREDSEGDGRSRSMSRSRSRSRSRSWKR